MIKLGTRKSLRKAGTVLLVKESDIDVVGGDFLVLTGKLDRGRFETISFATGERFWLSRDWLVKHTSIAFDARELVFDRERGN